MHTIMVDHDQYDHTVENDQNKIISILKQGFILNDFVFLIMRKNAPPFPITVKCDYKKNVMLIAVFRWNNGIRTQCQYGMLYHPMRGIGYWKIGKKGKEEDFIEGESEAAFELFDMCFQFMITILDKSYDRAVKYKKNEDLKIKDAEKIKEHNKLAGKMFPRKNIKLFDDLIIYTAQNYNPDDLKRKYLKPVWQVRGFYRHYKDGRVIYIKPFLKGRDRNKGMPGGNTYIAE